MKQTSYTIKIDSEIWKKFKLIVSKDKTMNDAIVELIKKEISGLR